MINLKKAQAAYARLSVRTAFPGAPLKSIVTAPVFKWEKALQRQKAWELLLQSGGRLTLTEVAKLVGVTRQSVSKWCKEDQWREKLADVSADVDILQRFHEDVTTLKKLIGSLKWVTND